MAFIVVSGIAVPLIGISHSLFLLAGLVFAGFLFGTTVNK